MSPFDVFLGPPLLHARLQLLPYTVNYFDFLMFDSLEFRGSLHLISFTCPIAIVICVLRLNLHVPQIINDHLLLLLVSTYSIIVGVCNCIADNPLSKLLSAWDLLFQNQQLQFVTKVPLKESGVLAESILYTPPDFLVLRTFFDGAL